MARNWTCGAALALCGIASLWAGPAEADRGILACTHGADGEYVTFELYSERTASLRGKVGGVEFNCPLEVEGIRVCGPNCHVPHDFTVQARLDTDRCSTPSPHWARDTLHARPDVRVSSLGSRMVWREREASACTAFRTDPAFTASLGVEDRTLAAPPGDISAWVGLYPHDEVGGVTFLEHPLVAAAVSQLAASNEETLRWIHDRKGPDLPIDRSGDRLVLTGCSADACPAHDWALHVAVDGSQARACHPVPGRPREATWYRVDGPPERIVGPCSGE